MSSGHDHDARTGGSWGLLLSGICAVGTCWLAATGKLGLYINPRYAVFSVVMAALGALACVVCFAVRARTAVSGRAWASVSAAVVLVAFVLVVPPSALTSATAQNRSVNAGTTTTTLGVDPSRFSLRQWAALVTTPSSATTYAGRKVTLTGYVSSAGTDHPDTFYLTRLVITCCALDAQPVGVPVSAVAWAGTYKPDQWLQVTGTFIPTTDGPGGAVIVLTPTTLDRIDQPAQPYEY